MDLWPTWKGQLDRWLVYGRSLPGSEGRALGHHSALHLPGWEGYYYLIYERNLMNSNQTRLPCRPGPSIEVVEGLPGPKGFPRVLPDRYWEPPIQSVGSLPNETTFFPVDRI